ncbi:unnamed protein product [Rotaria socialis]
MRVFACSLILLAFECTRTTQSYPDDAPSSACDSMMPSNGASSIPCQSNYVIEANKYQYSSNDNTQITVRGETSFNRFKSVLLVAKDSSDTNILGHWSSTDTSVSIVSCNDTLTNGITLTSSDYKSQIQATWHSPSTAAQGNIVIKATIVQSYGTFYVNCFNITLTPQNNPGPMDSLTNPLDRLVRDVAATSKVANTSVPSMNTTSSALTLNWAYANGTTTVAILTNNLLRSQWVAIGLSLDSRMGNDHVFVCQRLSDDTILLQRFINPDGHAATTIVTAGSNLGGIFQVNSVSFNNGIIYCEFSLSNFTATTSRRRKRSVTLLSQSTQYQIIVAIGPLAGPNSLVQHSWTTVLSQTMQLDQSGTISLATIGGSANLLRAHGIIMLFTWMLLVSTGIIIARYFKQSWPTHKLCGKAIWFAIHRFVMICSALMTAMGFLLILIYKNGEWTSRSLSHEFAHSIIGIIVCIAAAIQPAMALFRCESDDRHRFIFNYAHALLGTIALILATTAIMLSTFFISFNSVLNNYYGVVVAWLLSVFFIVITFECIELFSRKNWPPFKANNQTVSVQMGVINDSNEALPIDKQSPGTNILKERLKYILLALHILIAFGLSIALAAGIGEVA